MFGGFEKNKKNVFLNSTQLTEQFRVCSYYSGVFLLSNRVIKESNNFLIKLIRKSKA